MSLELDPTSPQWKITKKCRGSDRPGGRGPCIRRRCRSPVRIVFVGFPEKKGHFRKTRVSSIGVSESGFSCLSSVRERRVIGHAVDIPGHEKRIRHYRRAFVSGTAQERAFLQGGLTAVTSNIEWFPIVWFLSTAVKHHQTFSPTQDGSHICAGNVLID